MTIEEWAKDFKSYVNALDMQRDDYKGIMEYIDDALSLLKEQEAEIEQLNGLLKEDDKDSWKARALYAANKACENCEEYSEGLHKCGHCRIKKIKMDAKN